MFSKLFSKLQRVGQSFMIPIAVLPVAGLLMGIGQSFTNETMIQTYHLQFILGKGTPLYALFTIMCNAGNIVFDNLPILFAVGIAMGMAKHEKATAAFSALVAFLIMHASINALLIINGYIVNGQIADFVRIGTINSICGIQSLDIGVFGGIVVGLGVAYLHNRFYMTRLPDYLSFFAGTRFVPVICCVTFVFVGILFFYIWPPIQEAIYHLGVLIRDSSYAGTFVFGFIKRMLIPFGLHHVFYLPFWQTAVGGTMEVGGKLIQGGQNIFFAQLADSAHITHFSADATRYFSGEFIFMIFGLPGAALAMYRTAKPEKKKAVAGLLLSAALTSMLTGITEPLEFTFIFVAPMLYGIHCVFAGLAYMLMHLFNVGVGMTFSGGLIDMFLFGILQGNAKTNWIWIVIVGIGYFIVYYLLFGFLIKRFDLKTPGRDDSEEVKLYRRSDVEARKNGDNGSEASSEDALSQTICQGLGGKKNISDVDCCATRLRCTVHKAERVDDALLKSTGASGVVHKGNGVQIIYGPRVSVIKSNLEDYLETAPDEEFTAGGNDVDATAHAGVDTNVDGGTNAGVAENANTSSAEATVVETIVISSPITGLAADLSTTPDEAFAGKMMGDGAVVTPEDSVVRAPEDGEVCFVFETKHAIGFLTDSGVSLLIHMGIDTVALNGEGFEVFVENGQKVKKGEPLLSLNLDYLKENAPSLASPVLCTELEDNQKVRLLKDGQIKAGEALFAIDIYE